MGPGTANVGTQPSPGPGNFSVACLLYNEFSHQGRVADPLPAFHRRCSSEMDRSRYDCRPSLDAGGSRLFPPHEVQRAPLRRTNQHLLGQCLLYPRKRTSLGVLPVHLLNAWLKLLMSAYPKRNVISFRVRSLCFKYSRAKSLRSVSTMA